MEKASTKLAMKYLKLSKYDVILNKSLEPSPSQFPEICTGALQALYMLTVDLCGWNKIKDKLAAAVVEIYSKEELEAAIAYMESNLGRTATKKSVELSKRTQQIMHQTMLDVENSDTPD